MAAGRADARMLRRKLMESRGGVVALGGWNLEATEAPFSEMLVCCLLRSMDEICDSGVGVGTRKAGRTFDF